MLYTQGKTDCKPGEVGYDEQRLDVLNRHLQRLIDDGEIQCAAYCVSRKGKIFARGAAGKKSFRKDDNTPVQPDSIRYTHDFSQEFHTKDTKKEKSAKKREEGVFVRRRVPKVRCVNFTIR